MPGDACLNAPALMAVVTNTWLSQTIGDDQPRPGTSVFHATFIVVDHVVGSVSIVETALPAGPRNCGHTVSGGAGAVTSAVTNNGATNNGTRTRGSYLRYGRALWKMDAVLREQRVIDGQRLVAARDGEAEEVGHHQRHEDLIVLRQLEDHEHRCHRRADDAGEKGAHAHERVRARITDRK